MTALPTRLVVAAAVVDDLHHPRRLLTARRSSPPALAGHWELPGGKVEPGEHLVPALRRELHEELGIRVTVGEELLPRTGTAWPVSHGFVMRVWWCTTADRPALTPGHDALRWVDASTINDLPWLAGDREIVAQLAERLRASEAAHPSW
jgi:8-oxo-dGTP diphosphatase